MRRALNKGTAAVGESKAASAAQGHALPAGWLDSTQSTDRPVFANVAPERER